VDTPAEFERWVQQQQAPAATTDAKVEQGREIFESTACVNCHRVAGTAAQGKFGPDLTHFASRETLAAGAAPNDRSDLWLWIKNPDAIKPGALMPAMTLSNRELDAVTAYLMTLK
jgi:cytochrome c oxidase subunit 2